MFKTYSKVVKNGRTAYFSCKTIQNTKGAVTEYVIVPITEKEYTENHSKVSAIKADILSMLSDYC
jgi:hypothetical protein